MESCQPGVALLKNADGKIVLPQGAAKLIARICAVAHQGRHGHLPHKVSTQMIRRYFQWPDLAKDVKSWMGRCLQYITAPHCQWSNGRVERLNRVFIKGMRALLASRGVDFKEWPRWVPAV